MRPDRLLRAVSMVLLLGALMLGLGALAPAAGDAAVPHLATLPALDTIQLGPVSAADGFNLYVTAEDCGSSDPYIQLAYVTTSPGVQLSHTYTGMSASCAIRRRPAGARLVLSVPGLLNVAVGVADAQTALAHPGLPVGCGPPYGPELPATATGHIDVAIHPSVFGRVAVSSTSAQIFPGTPQVCPAVQSTGGRELTADIGTTVLAADQPTRGPATLDLLDVSHGDTPAPGLQGALALQMSGASAFAVDAATGSARIGGDSPLTAGSLSFTPLPACPGDSAQNGTLSGALSVEDPLFGLRRIIGADADTAYSGLGGAQPGTCNGLGSEPLEPELIDTCNSADAGCSLSADSAEATFFDETSPGTQTITAETVDFGDGSAPVAITNYGAVQHVYTTPGTYTATLAVSDAAGTVSTTTASVVIDP